MSVCRSVMRVLLAVVVVTAGGIAWADVVAAAGKEINATADPGKCDKTWGPPCFAPSNGTVTQINQGDTVTWKSLDGTHTVSPADGSSFAGSGDLTGPDGTFSVTFDKAGTFSFFCKHHGSVEDGGKIHHGMWGKIEVKAGDSTATTAPPGPPPGNQPPPNPDPGSPGPTQPPSPPPSGSPPPATSNGSTGGGSNANGQGGGGQTAAGSGKPFVGPPPTQAAPPPTRAAFSGPPATEPAAPKAKEKDQKAGSDSTGPAEATAVPPDEAVLPPSPQFPTATTAPLAVSPGDVPHGDTIAVLKNEPGGRRRKLVLIVTFLGIGAFAAGVGGWKYANRPSKYWPA